MTLFDANHDHENLSERRSRDRAEWTLIMYAITGMTVLLVVQSVLSQGLWSLDFLMSSLLLISLAVIALRMGCPFFQLRRWLK